MQLFSRRNDEEKVYVDQNYKIQWIWSHLGGTRIKTLLQESQLPVNPLIIALLAGLMAGVVLSFI